MDRLLFGLRSNSLAVLWVHSRQLNVQHFWSPGMPYQPMAVSFLRRNASVTSIHSRWYKNPRETVTGADVNPAYRSVLIGA